MTSTQRPVMVDARVREPSADMSGPGPRPGHRPDIEGMRAVAVLLVVLGHAGLGFFAGGYVGVDVFFVISGFLITLLLTRELATTGRISISRFYARRALRLLPASTVVLAATLVGSWLWLSPIRFRDHLADVLASAAYAINFRLAITGTDYLNATDPPSPLQHFWSLAVEEQFYLGWPLLILLVAWACRRLGRVRTKVLAGTLALIILGSFALSISETARNAPWAYFGLHTRAWELGVGALLAIGAERLTRLPERLAAVMTWCGLLAILVAAVLFDQGTAFPGYAAALPVAGAALLIAGGSRRPAGGARLILDRSPFQLLGRLSYGWYLWHWPVLMIAPAALGVAASVPVNLLLCAFALVIAQVSLSLVENPVRHHRSLLARPGRGIGLGLSLSSAVVLATLFASTVPPTVPAGRTTTDLPSAMTSSADKTRVITDFVATAVTTRTLPANLRPPLEQAEQDIPRIYPDRCHLGVTDVDIPSSCVYGDPDSSTTVVLFGDSHAAQWFPAMEHLARQHRWRLVPLTKSSCTAADISLYEESLKRTYTECRTWRSNAFRRIAELAPELVVVSSIVDHRGAKDAADPMREWRDGWARTFTALQHPGTAVALIADTPHLAANGPDCVAQHPRSLTTCAPQVAAGLREPDRRAAVAEVAGQRGVTVIDPIPWLCLDVCPMVIGNVLVYRDAHHLTTEFVMMVTPLLHGQLPTMTG